jgi:hypothetical protein
MWNREDQGMNIITTLYCTQTITDRIGEFKDREKMHSSNEAEDDHEYPLGKNLSRSTRDIC